MDSSLPQASDGAYLKLVLDHAPVILFATDPQGVLTFAGGQMLHSLGLSPRQVIGRSIFSLYAQEPMLLSAFRRALSGETFTAQLQVGKRTYQTTYQPLRSPDGALLGCTGVSVDLTEQVRIQRRAEALLHLSELMESGLTDETPRQTLKTALEVLSRTMPLDVLILWDNQNDHYFPLAVHGRASESGQAQLERGVSAAYFQRIGVLKTRPVFWETAELPPEVASLGISSLALLPLTVSDQDRPLLLGAYRTGAPQGWTPDEQQLLTAAARSIAVWHGRYLQLATLEAAAHRDPLTRLGNRRAFERDLDRAMAHAARTNQTVGILSIDVDGLKRVNDQQGHEQGDTFLYRFAEALTDTWRNEDQVYRLGGDEFAVLLPGLHTKQAPEIYHRLAAAVEQTRQAGFSSAGASGGVAVFPDEAPTAAALLQLADHRMYETKEAHVQSRAAPGEQTVLVVEDQPGMARVIELALRGAGYQVEVCQRASTARTRLQAGGVNLLVTDLALPEGPQAGLELVRELRAGEQACPVLFLSANADTRMRVAGLLDGADDYLVKPFDRAELVARVGALLRRGTRNTRR